MFLNVYNPFQQSPSLQDTAPQLQGGSAPLQGNLSPTVLTAPAPAVAPETAPTAPIKPKAVPTVNDLSGRFANVNGTIYDKGTGQGYSDPASFFQASGVNSFNNLKLDTAWTPQTQQPQAPVNLDPNQNLAQQAGGAGLALTDLSKLFGASQEDQNTVYKNLGIDTLQQEVFSKPSKTTEQIYNNAYASAGLADIKAKFQTLQDTINKRYEDLTKEVGQISENPWISEASRIGRVKRLQDLAQADITNVERQAQQFADLYNTGLEQVNQVVQNTTADFSQNQQLNQQKLTYLVAQAEKQLNSQTDSKISRYLPDYLKGKTDATTSKYTTLNQGDTLIDPKTGKVIYSAPKTYAPGTGSGSGATNLSSTTLTKVQSVANQFDGEQIVKDFNVVQNKYQSVNQILNSKLGGPGDLAVVYEFMKGLDPTSVVRETEYASAAKSGNIFAGVFAKFNGYLNPNGGFLPDQVKQSFLSILNSKLSTVQKQYQNLYDEYGRRINKLTGNTDGTEFITNYAKAFGSTGTSSNVQDAINKWVP